MFYSIKRGRNGDGERGVPYIIYARERREGDDEGGRTVGESEPNLQNLTNVDKCGQMWIEEGLGRGRGRGRGGANIVRRTRDRFDACLLVFC